MRFVPVKTAERQGELRVLRTRELLVRQRTQAVNTLRGHATEFGLVVPLGVSRVEELFAKLPRSASRSTWRQLNSRAGAISLPGLG